MFDSLCFDLIVTTMVLRFQTLKEKEDPVAEDALVETPSRDHGEIVVDVEVTKIKNENLTASEGQDATETVACAIPDDTEQEKRAEV
jgi:hypothetical protein